MPVNLQELTLRAMIKTISVKNKKLFEKYFDIINSAIIKRRSKWTLSAVAWMDYSDVHQIILIHIYRKIHLWDQNRPLEPWLNTLITHQISNLLRNLFSNFSRPCLKCAAAEGDNLCTLYTTQCAACPIFDYWQKHKKNAYNTKLPLTIENHIQEVFEIPNESIDIDKTLHSLHFLMKDELTKYEYNLYKDLYIKHLSEAEVVSSLYRQNKSNSINFYIKQLANIKKIIMKKAKKLIYSGNIDFVN